jgi:thiosulfate/3-mercaptopyruvate sulfurtransferase
MKKVGLYVFIAFISLAIVGCAGHGTSVKGKEIPIESAAVKLVSDAKAGGFNLVTTEDLKKRIDEGKKMIIISTLPVEEDKKFGTLPGALSAPLPKTEKELTKADKDNLLKVAGLDKEKEIVLYCGFVACRRSTIGAKILVEEGYKNVTKYPGGITAWIEAGYPVEGQGK